MKQQPVDKSEIYDEFARLTQQTKDLVASVELLSDQLTKVLAENARLTIENEHLQEVVAAQQPAKPEEDLSESRKMLQKLYQEGFHVCNDMYGKRLEENESCTFCLDAIYGRHN
ncbi:DNA replication initiation control protein YabA [Limosilactobacillus caecicola]|uniref:DNA replication initiation control protein YabA n=1 Tax=Limosilactobacillus caecicola TaxID=2941332 RepID=UPI0020409E87|nr:DNA replication initiation control protein YabA [Limosilactobacillus caecicola]